MHALLSTKSLKCIKQYAMALAVARLEEEAGPGADDRRIAGYSHGPTGGREMTPEADRAERPGKARR